MDNVKPKLQVKFESGIFKVEGDLMAGETILGEIDIKIHPTVILKAIAEATPTDIDDKLLPFAEMIIAAIGSKKVSE